MLIDSWVNPTSTLIGVLGVANGAYLAAVYLAGDARRGDFEDLVEAFRRRALGTAAVTGLLAIGGLFVVRDDAPDLYAGLSSGGGLVMVVISTAAGIATIALVWLRRFGVARLSASLAVATLTVGWALAQDPYLLPGELTVEQAAASDATLGALFFSVAIGMVILVPSLAFLYRLVLRGQLDQEYEPLDHRFRPLTASDEEPSRQTRPRRTALVFALLAVAVVTMLGFEATITRVIGVPALFGFVAAGAFAIADHDFLDPAGETADEDAAAAGTPRAQER